MNRVLLFLAKSLAIIAAASAVGLTVNAFRKDGLPLREAIDASSPATTPGGSCTSSGPVARVPEVQLDEARVLLGRPGVTFVDARDAAVFNRGHIQGAVNLPFDVAAQTAGVASLPVPHDHRIIVYCDYFNCQLSELLAQVLSRHGCERVRVLQGGYPSWLKAGYPTEATR